MGAPWNMGSLTEFRMLAVNRVVEGGEKPSEVMAFAGSLQEIDIFLVTIIQEGRGYRIRVCR